MIDLARLMKLRTVVARFGELDLGGWWNTKGQMKSAGTLALRRGFPRTHYFAQARSVFAVAAHRCAEVFDAPRSVSLFRLPESTEEEFDEEWEDWLDHAGDWTPFFQRVENMRDGSLVEHLRAFKLVSEVDIESLARLRRSADNRAVQLQGEYRGTDDDVTLLALGFARGERGTLAVPYSKLS